MSNVRSAEREDSIAALPRVPALVRGAVVETREPHAGATGQGKVRRGRIERVRVFVDVDPFRDEVVVAHPGPLAVARPAAISRRGLASLEGCFRPLRCRRWRWR